DGAAEDQPHGGASGGRCRCPDPGHFGWLSGPRVGRLGGVGTRRDTTRAGRTPLDWDALRRAEFPVAERWAYFDHAAVAPLPRRARDRLVAWADEQVAQGVVGWPKWESKVEDIRKVAARLIGAEDGEIAFVANTTHGIGLVA